uniref:U83-Liphistoxin-Lth1a_1 n=1 Tax=Liphistius thaleban TaxID=1905330 RepID=A0A4Q8K6M6_9ARAC
MKVTLVVVLCGLTLAAAASRSKRAAYELPDGAELLVGPIRTAFACSSDGYYADVENNCQIFHVCHTVPHDDGSSETQQWSFLCGNQTVFNQLTFSCAYPEEAVPCPNARDFYYLNQNLGAGPNVPFLTEQDVARAAPLIPGLGARSVHPPTGPGPRPRPGGGFRGGK